MGESDEDRVGLLHELSCVSPAFAENFAKGLKNCRVVQLSSGLHYLQEDHPDVIGTTVKEWLIDVGFGSSPKQKAAVYEKH